MSNGSNESKVNVREVKEEVEEVVEPSIEWVRQSGYAQAQGQLNSQDGGIFGLIVDSLHDFQQAYDFEANEFKAVLSPCSTNSGNHKLRDLHPKELDKAVKEIRYKLDKFPKTRFSQHTSTSYNRKDYTGKDAHQENFYIPDSVDYKFKPPTTQSELVFATLAFIDYCTDRPFCPPIPTEEKRASLAQKIDGHDNSWRIKGFPFNPFGEYTVVPNTTVLYKTPVPGIAPKDSDDERSELQSPANEQDDSASDSSVSSRPDKRRRH